MQTRASLEEWKQAPSLSGDPVIGDHARYDCLRNRVRRLIDLLSIADQRDIRHGQTALALPSRNRSYSAGNWSGEK